LQLGVILDGGTALPGDLRVTSFPEETAHALGQDPCVISSAAQLDAIGPAYSIRQIWGDRDGAAAGRLPELPPV
jgi:hypothetical protein